MSPKKHVRTILNVYNLPNYFWANVVYTIAYVLNKTLIRPILKKWKKYKGRSLI